eukprot:2012052-Amphidinium_carterae.1
MAPACVNCADRIHLRIGVCGICLCPLCERCSPYCRDCVGLEDHSPTSPTISDLSGTRDTELDTESCESEPEPEPTPQNSCKRRRIQ